MIERLPLGRRQRSNEVKTTPPPRPSQANRSGFAKSDLPDCLGEPRLSSDEENGRVRPRADDASRHELPSRWRERPSPSNSKKIAADRRGLPHASPLPRFRRRFLFPSARGGLAEIVTSSTGKPRARFPQHRRPDRRRRRRRRAVASRGSAAGPPLLSSAFPPFLRGVNFRARTRRSAARDRRRVKGCLYVVLNMSVRAEEDTPLRGIAQTRVPRSAERRTEGAAGAFNSDENARYAQVIRVGGGDAR